MLKVILDTDMGVDCDDAVALAVLLKAEKKKKVVGFFRGEGRNCDKRRRGRKISALDQSVIC